MNCQWNGVEVGSLLEYRSDEDVFSGQAYSNAPTGTCSELARRNRTPAVSIVMTAYSNGL